MKKTAFQVFLMLGLIESMVHFMYHMAGDRAYTFNFLVMAIMQSNFISALMLEPIARRYQSKRSNPSEHRLSIINLFGIVLFCAQMALNAWVLYEQEQLGFWWAILFFVAKLFLYWHYAKKYELIAT